MNSEEGRAERRSLQQLQSCGAFVDLITSLEVLRVLPRWWNDTPLNMVESREKQNDAAPGA